MDMKYPTKKSERSNAMIIINKDKNGNVITDLSKVVIPDDIALDILSILNPNFTFERSTN